MSRPAISAFSKTGKLFAKIIPLIILLILLITVGNSAITGVVAIDIILAITIGITLGTLQQIGNDFLHKPRIEHQQRKNNILELKNILNRSAIIFFLMQILLILTYISTPINPLLYIIPKTTFGGYLAITIIASILAASTLSTPSYLSNITPLKKIIDFFQFNSPTANKLNDASLVITALTTLILAMVMSFTIKPNLALFICLPSIITITAIVCRLVLPPILKSLSLSFHASKTAGKKLINSNKNNPEITPLNTPTNTTNFKLLGQLHNIQHDDHSLAVKILALPITHPATFLLSLLTTISLPSFAIPSCIYIARALVSFKGPQMTPEEYNNAFDAAPLKGALIALLICNSIANLSLDMRQWHETITTKTVARTKAVTENEIIGSTPHDEEAAIEPSTLVL